MHSSQVTVAPGLVAACSRGPGARAWARGDAPGERAAGPLRGPAASVAPVRRSPDGQRVGRWRLGNRRCRSCSRTARRTRAASAWRRRTCWRSWLRWRLRWLCVSNMGLVLLVCGSVAGGSVAGASVAGASAEWLAGADSCAWEAGSRRLADARWSARPDGLTSDRRIDADAAVTVTASVRDRSDRQRSGPRVDRAQPVRDRREVVSRRLVEARRGAPRPDRLSGSSGSWRAPPSVELWRRWTPERQHLAKDRGTRATHFHIAAVSLLSPG